MSVVITIVEAEVAPDRERALEDAYRAMIESIDPAIEQTYLMRDLKPRVWRIITFWESPEALAKVRESGQPPRGALVFRAAGAEPKLVGVGDVRLYSSRK